MKNKGSILIVEDDVGMRKTMSFVLQRNGCAVEIAHDGLEAIEKVKERAFDIVFIDIKMPRMNGVEACRNIKKIRPEAVVMMMTAHAVENQVEEALHEGAYTVLSKPLDMDEVLRLIAEVLEKKKRSS